MPSTIRTVRSAAALALLAGLVAPAMAQYTTPNVINTSNPITTSLNGTQFTNYGLVGVGRISASMLDAQGSTFGSVSSLAISPGSWQYNAATGQFSGQFLTLPDRGRNDPVNNVYVNYQARIQQLGFTFTPSYNGSGASQNQIQFNYQGLTMLTESNGQPLVGMDPGTGVGTAFGRPVPRVGGPNGNLAIDAEGLVATPDGGYYVSDEYGSAIYRFNAGGVLQGVINPPEALMPRNNGALDFNSATAPQQGRRNNQGMEGLSLSPDGRYLFAMNQSGAMQDSAGSNQANRRFTRVMVYDLQNNPIPTDPIGQYVVELPTTNVNGNGSAVNRTAAASEIVAISDTQFMILSRDSNGRGPSTGLPPVFRSVLLADISARRTCREPTSR
ncbi:MAG: esterase-like activity of phytase family protein [Phycisphaerales bacterium]